MARTTTFFFLAVFLALMAFLFLALTTPDSHQGSSPLVGQQVPDFSLPSIEGLQTSGVTSAMLQAGNRLKVVNFWASWCPPCRAEHPLLMELATRADLQVVGINYKDTPTAASRFLSNFGNPYALLGADTTGRVAIDMGLLGVPETFLISADGVILYHHKGPLTARVIAQHFTPPPATP